MKRMQSWVVGLVVILAVIGLLFGGLTVLVQSEVGSRVLATLPGGHEGRGERPSPFGDGTFSPTDSDGAFGGGFRQERGGGGGDGGQFDLGRGLLETAVNVIKIALVVAVTAVALPALWRLLKRRNAQPTMSD